MRGRLVSVQPAHHRGRRAGGQLLNWWLVRDLPAGASDEFIRGSWFGQAGWRWMFALNSSPFRCFLLGMFFVPESPRWPSKKGRVTEATKTLTRIGGEA